MVLEAAQHDIQTFEDVLTRLWMYNRRLVFYTIHAPVITRRTVDTISAAIVDTMHGWPCGMPYLALQHFTEPGLTPTPYIREKTAEIAACFPQLQGRVATVLKPITVAQVTQRWLEHLAQSQQPNLPHRVFLDVNVALDWLLEALPHTATP
ncbi:MAG: hypothetical protein HC915_20515 [Anaerolineae bacterium]|nr:hypothetical protein [Anaerolineae bacterium]